MEHALIFSIITAAVTLGGVFIAVGVFKGKLHHAIETNAAQGEQIKGCVTRDDLAKAIHRSDEMLDMMRARAEEDRTKADGKYREFHSLLNRHSERIASLETSHAAVIKTLDEIKLDMKTGFREVQSELKDVSNEIKNWRKQE